MRLLTYHDLDVTGLEEHFERFRAAIESDNFAAAKLKKLRPSRYHRAKLTHTHRLVVEFRQYQGEAVCLALEVIREHKYQQGRFMFGVPVQEDRIEEPELTAPPEVAGLPTLRYLHPEASTFMHLGQPMSFDDEQRAALESPAPLVLLGSAGSGKTALLLERLLREHAAHALYLSRSDRLARHARELAGERGQDTEFLSLQTLLTLAAPLTGRELQYKDFAEWTARRPEIRRFTRPRLLFEEFRGALSAPASGPLALGAYESLGIRHSLYPPEERARVHGLFGTYRAWLAQQQDLYDPNLAAADRLHLAPPLRAGAIAIDEVQDLSPVALNFVLNCLQQDGSVFVAGDAHQLIYGGRFSWSATRSLIGAAQGGPVRALSMNFRSAARVVEVANRVLHLKQRRFGSLEREDNFLARSAETESGTVTLLGESPAVHQALNAHLKGNPSAAVLVLRDEDLPGAQAAYQTPLIFSLEEAKGLEYEEVVLHRLVGSDPEAFAVIAGDLTAEDLEGELRYSRARDKDDASAQTHGALLNGLYVALTRARTTVTLTEPDPEHPLLRALLPGVGRSAEKLAQSPRPSATRGDWAREASRLEQQGHLEQAQAIRTQGLAYQQAPWEVFTRDGLLNLLTRTEVTSAQPAPNAKTQRALAEWARHNDLIWINEEYAERFHEPLSRSLLEQGQFREDPAALERTRKLYAQGVHKDVKADVDRYGPDTPVPRLGLTPLALAVKHVNLELAQWLIDQGANRDATDVFGITAHQSLFTYNYPEEQMDDLRQLHGLLAPPLVSVRVDGHTRHLPNASLEARVLTTMFTQLKATGALLDSAASVRHAAQQGFTLFEGMPDDLIYDLITDIDMQAAYAQNVLASGEAADWLIPEDAQATKRFSDWMAAHAAEAHALWTEVPLLKERTALSRNLYLPSPNLEILRTGPDGADLWEPLLERFAGELLDLPAFYREPLMPALQTGDLQRLYISEHWDGDTLVSPVSQEHLDHQDPAVVWICLTFLALRKALPVAQRLQLSDSDMVSLIWLLQSNMITRPTNRPLHELLNLDEATGPQDRTEQFYTRSVRRLVRDRLLIQRGTLPPVVFFHDGRTLTVSRHAAHLSDAALRAISHWQRRDTGYGRDLAPAVRDELQEAGLGYLFPVADTDPPGALDDKNVTTAPETAEPEAIPLSLSAPAPAVPESMHSPSAHLHFTEETESAPRTDPRGEVVGNWVVVPVQAEDVRSPDSDQQALPVGNILSGHRVLSAEEIRTAVQEAGFPLIDVRYITAFKPVRTDTQDVSLEKFLRTVRAASPLPTVLMASSNGSEPGTLEALSALVGQRLLLWVRTGPEGFFQWVQPPTPPENVTAADLTERLARGGFTLNTLRNTGPISHQPEVTVHGGLDGFLRAAALLGESALFTPPGMGRKRLHAFCRTLTLAWYDRPEHMPGTHTATYVRV